MEFTESQNQLIDKEIKRHNSTWPSDVGVIIARGRNEDGSVDFSSAIEITESDFNSRIKEVSK